MEPTQVFPVALLLLVVAFMVVLGTMMMPHAVTFYDLVGL